MYIMIVFTDVSIATPSSTMTTRMPTGLFSFGCLVLVVALQGCSHCVSGYASASVHYKTKKTTSSQKPFWTTRGHNHNHNHNDESSSSSSSSLGLLRRPLDEVVTRYDELDIPGVTNPWKYMAFNLMMFHTPEEVVSSVSLMRTYLQIVTLLRVGIPSLLWSSAAALVYPSFSLVLASAINDADVFNVVANDYSQYIQNILTTSGLTFSLLVGNTYYFMYQQQEGKNACVHACVPKHSLFLNVCGIFFLQHV